MRLLGGYGEIIAAAILFSFAGIFAKAIVGLDALSTTFYRVFFALLIFSGVLLATRKFGTVRLGGDKIRQIGRAHV
jgi:EamA domain-containing membrane protein RarD